MELKRKSKKSINRGDVYKRQVYPSNFYGEEDDSSIQSMQWQSIWNEIVNEALMLSGFDSISEVPDLTVDAQVLLSGLLIVADWIASNTCLLYTSSSVYFFSSFGMVTNVVLIFIFAPGAASLLYTFPMEHVMKKYMPKEEKKYTEDGEEIVAWYNE